MEHPALVLEYANARHHRAWSMLLPADCRTTATSYLQMPEIQATRVCHDTLDVKE